jgi:hypothetical protein
MKNKVILLNYLLNKTLKDKQEMDIIYNQVNDYISFSKKIYGPITKHRMINNNLFGIELIINNI